MTEKWPNQVTNSSELHSKGVMWWKLYFLKNTDAEKKCLDEYRIVIDKENKNYNLYKTALGQENVKAIKKNKIISERKRKKSM